MAGIRWEQVRGVVMDMDGVLWRGAEKLPGVDAWFAFLRAHDVPFALATNNSSRSPGDYADKLAALGIAGVQPEQIVTSGTATVHHLRTHYPAGARVHVLGGAGLKAMLTGAGFAVEDGDSADPAVLPAVVVAGIDFDLTYARLKTAALLIRRGIPFIGTNDDATFPMPDGLAPGAGSLLAALKTATEVAPQVMGKPAPALFTAAVAALGAAPGEALMIGDRLNTDIEGAAALGLQTALVLTGVSTRAEAEAAAVSPDGVFAGLADLQAAWDDALSRAGG
jgi:4-nitrophenyl phosphatase